MEAGKILIIKVSMESNQAHDGEQLHEDGRLRHIQSTTKRRYTRKSHNLMMKMMKMMKMMYCPFLLQLTQASGESNGIF